MRTTLNVDEADDVAIAQARSPSRSIPAGLRPNRESVRQGDTLVLCPAETAC